MLVQNQALEGEDSAIPPEPQPRPSTLQPNVSEPQTESLQTKAHIEQILPSPSTYQRKQRKTQKHRRAKKVTELPYTSVPLDHGADEAVHKEGVIDLGTKIPHWGVHMLRLGLRLHLKHPMTHLCQKLTHLDVERIVWEYHDDLMDFVPPTPHDSPLSGGNTPGSDEGRIELIQELMETYTSLTKRVLALEEAKTA
ncbi:hypothetical protein Tco_1161074 [Tanacetum coccineum]